MCGIFGVLNPKEAGVSPERARAGLALLAHRGPDDEGWFEGPNVYLGHRRLTIMDLSSDGHEPMSNEDGTVWLTFNGEIYRFGEIRRELESLGHRFRSSCDAEVLIHGYEEWGRGVLDRVDGMFAFGLWDANAERLLVARDRMGKKPLFLAERNGCVVFASQMRSVLATGIVPPVVDRRSLREFLFLNYVVGPSTIFRGVELVPPGTWIEWRGGGRSAERYWSLDEEPAEAPETGEGDPFEALLTEATESRLVSDAPLGIFLSGGVDSAVVAALAQRASAKPRSTFTVGFADASYDERAKAARVAARLGTDHHEILCGPDDIPGLVETLVESADHLLADQSIIPLIALARETKQHVKTVLTGDGGDELLAGYPTYRALAAAAAYQRALPAPARRLLGSLADRLPVRSAKMAAPMVAARFLRATSGSLAEAHASWRAIWSPAEIDELLGDDGVGYRGWERYAERFDRRSDWPLVKSAVYADVQTWLVDSILAKVDRATMASGLEARSPLLDSRLFQYCFHTLLADPSRNAGKRALRDLGTRLLGREIALAPKAGFQAPFSAWFSGPLREYVRAKINSLGEALPGVLDSQVLDRVEREHADGVRDHGLKLWGIVALSEWSQTYPGISTEDPQEERPPS